MSLKGGDNMHIPTLQEFYSWAREEREEFYYTNATGITLLKDYWQAKKEQEQDRKGEND